MIDAWCPAETTTAAAKTCVITILQNCTVQRGTMPHVVTQIEI